ncbi:hypothetical protein G6L37_06680 [Agrobacterium rubi]|nr:hypothetical protein [Agrobacterium rubi]NTF25049.1 hypothetical protein [Agrobacterium rubi]
MGWTTMPMPREGTTEWFRQTLTWTSENGATTRPLATAIVERKEAYAAVETVHPDGRRQVWAAIFLLDYQPRARDGYTFGYKDMDETVGPAVCRCPEKILDMLTETESEYANSWRQRCRERLLLRQNNKLKDGDIIQLDHKLNYSGYGEFDMFQMRLDRGRSLFYALDNETLKPQFLCRITNWRERTFTRIDREEYLASTAPAAKM